MSSAPIPRARPNGWYGMLALVATESALFGTLLATYAYLRFRLGRPPAGIAPPSVTAPIVLAPCSSRRACRWRSPHAPPAQHGPARRPVVLALAVQAGYLAFQAHLFAADLVASRPTTPPTGRSTSRCSPSTTRTWRS